MSTELQKVRSDSEAAPKTGNDVEDPDVMNESGFNIQANPRRGAIRVFTPAHFEDAAKKGTKYLDGLVKKALPFKILPRAYRCAAFLIGAVLCAIILTYAQVNFHWTKAISLMLTGMFFAYFAHIYFLVGYSRTAHRIYSLSGVVPEWTSMPITSRQLVYQYDPIQSISEFSAIGGGVANQMLVVISSCAWITLLTVQLNNIWFEKIWLTFTNDLNCGGCDRKIVNLFEGSSGLDGIFMFIGTFGLLMIGIFELDPYSKLLQNGHMTGVYLGFFCPIGFSAQQLYAFINDGGFKKHPVGIISSIALDIIAIVFALVWTCYFNKKSDKLAEELKKPENIPQTDDQEKDAQRRIRDLSIANVVSESITLIAGSMCLCLWLWNYNDVYTSYFKNPDEDYGVLPSGGPWKQFYEFLVDKYDCGTTVVQPRNNTAVVYC